uniref:Uncharacterized protein n=1 Tax=Brassica oleracea var. oleracea TaxID=109376 RepID=A0A0D3BDJ5_BRAOL
MIEYAIELSSTAHPLPADGSPPDSITEPRISSRASPLDGLLVEHLFWTHLLPSVSSRRISSGRISSRASPLDGLLVEHLFWTHLLPSVSSRRFACGASLLDASPPEREVRFDHEDCISKEIKEKQPFPPHLKDAIVGNNQKSGTFWKRVGDLFFAALCGGDCVESSQHLHYKQRWHKISNDTSKFCGAYAAAERQISSGEHENDVLKVAHDIFFADQGSKFTLEHAWCVLRYEQKWLNLNNTKASDSSKRKTVESDSQTETTGVGEEEIRPEGVKAAKAKRNGSGKSVDYYTTVLELRKVDLDRKEKLQKLAILDTLLARTQPLSEAEEAAKNKLLAEYI